MKRKYFLYIIIASLFTSCIKQVDLDIKAAEKFMYLDAFITNQVRQQQVYINYSEPYLGESQPQAVEGATVVLHNISTGNDYTFNYNNGKYIYNPASPLVTVGDSAVLEITINGTTYTASDKMFRVPQIDSVTLHYKSQSVLYEEGIYAEVHIVDLPGATDYYWLKSTYNSDDPLKGNNLVIDGGYYEDLFDGLPFISPIREAVNEYGPFETGGKIDVRLRSLSKPTYAFLERIANNTSTGGLFSGMIKDIPTNVETPANAMKLLGWFATTAERNMSVIIP